VCVCVCVCVRRTCSGETMRTTTNLHALCTSGAPSGSVSEVSARGRGRGGEGITTTSAEAKILEKNSLRKEGNVISRSQYCVLNRHA